MGTLTIRNLTEDTKQALRLRGAVRGASMEDEARSILRAVVQSGLSVDELVRPDSGQNAWDSIQALRERHGTFEFAVPERTGVAGTRVVFEDT
ncbi:MAG TPA: plasmid stabilization protein [Rhizobiales bacterium]|nr:plasmid stabilization protein [Hyphomicrobiales bacterium]